MKNAYKIVSILLILLGGSIYSCSTAFSLLTFTDFYDFLIQYEVAPAVEKPTIIDEYISWQNSSGGGFPAIVNSTHVVFIYYNASRNITECEVLLDIFEMDPLSMTRLEPEIAFFYLGITLKPSTRTNYLFSIDGTKINDPRNPYLVKARFSAALLEFESELALPPFEREFHYIYDPSILHGSLTPLSDFSSDPFVQLYLPPNYNSSLKYPVAYFADGSLYTDLINASMILDNLIDAGMITPIIAVFADWAGFDPNHPSESDWSLRHSFYSTKSIYLSFIDSLVSYVDSHYSTIDSPYARLHVGLSLTGYASAYVAVDRSSTMKLVAIQSAGPADLINSLVTNDYENAPTSLDLKIWVCVGTYESNVEWEGNNLTKANEYLATVCDSNEWDIEIHLFAEGHSFAFWTHTLDEILIHFFPPGYIPQTSPQDTSSIYFLPVILMLFLMSTYQRKRF